MRPRTRLPLVCALLIPAALAMAVDVVPDPPQMIVQPAQAGDPPRLRVATNAYGRTLHTVHDEPLRGHFIMVKAQHAPGRFEAGGGDHALDPAYWGRLKAVGLNCVRLVFFDPYQWSNGYDAALLFPWSDGDLAASSGRRTFQYNDPHTGDWAFILERMDAIVDLAAQHDMHVVINFHDVPTGSYRALDMAYCAKFWSVVAPRYRQRTHVAYELANETVPWFLGDYQDADLAAIKTIYNLVRHRAPDSQLLVITCANVASHGTTLEALTDRFAEIPPSATSVPIPYEAAIATGKTDAAVDWMRTAVAWHAYTHADALDVTPAMARYPLVCTESSFTRQQLDANGHPGQVEGKPMADNEQLVPQTLERLGMGWISWYGFEEMVEGVLRSDAQAKGWYWRCTAPTSAAPGAQVRIDAVGTHAQGTGPFAEVTEVRIGASSSAAIVERTATSVTIVVPDDASTGHVRLLRSGRPLGPPIRTALGASNWWGGAYPDPPAYRSESCSVVLSHAPMTVSGAPANRPPVIVTGPTATPSEVTGATTTLAVTASDPDGDALSITWQPTSRPAGAPAPLIGSGPSPVVTFALAGLYEFEAAISDGQATTTSAVAVNVIQTPSLLVIQE